MPLANTPVDCNPEAAAHPGDEHVTLPKYVHTMHSVRSQLRGCSLDSLSLVCLQAMYLPKVKGGAKEFPIPNIK